MIKYLDHEDELAGVLSHEIAHADRRHSTHMLTKAYGINLLLNVILGNDNEQVSNITQSLISLKFSRDAEHDADKHSVIYLCQDNVIYQADGAARFFEKMLQEEKRGYMPEFLSTHPSSPNRIKHIENTLMELKCSGNSHSDSDYIKLKNTLP
ncbi:MAG: M48 family metallopeptidase [Cytophagaceae bacterium]|nr:M48 family metallopeptidase [Cytophagaceae bacterium]